MRDIVLEYEGIYNQYYQSRGERFQMRCALEATKQAGEQRRAHDEMGFLRKSDEFRRNLDRIAQRAVNRKAS
jgi:hypothetical protein